MNPKTQLASVLTVGMLVAALGLLLDSLGMIAACPADSSACWVVWTLAIPSAVGVAWLALRTLRRLP